MKLRHLLLASFVHALLPPARTIARMASRYRKRKYRMIDANVSLTATALDEDTDKGAAKEVVMLC